MQVGCTKISTDPPAQDKLQAFNQADRDRSGQMSWEEFKTAGKKLKELATGAFAHRGAKNKARESAAVRLQAGGRGKLARQKTKEAVLRGVREARP